MPTTLGCRCTVETSDKFIGVTGKQSSYLGSCHHTMTSKPAVLDAENSITILHQLAKHILAIHSDRSNDDSQWEPSIETVHGAYIYIKAITCKLESKCSSRHLHHHEYHLLLGYSSMLNHNTSWNEWLKHGKPFMVLNDTISI